MVEFLLGSHVLATIGIPYDVEGGSLFVKLHPGTYLAACAMLIRLTRATNQLAPVWSLICREWSLSLYLAAILSCTAYEICLHGIGNAILLADTFLPAGMLGVALCGISAPQTQRLATLLRALFLVNATLALAEGVSGHVLLPNPFPGRDADSEYRSAALYDHPLSGAAATMLGLLLSPDARRAPFRYYVYLLWMFMALASFGGRVAFGLAVVGALGQHAWCVTRKGLSRRLAPIDFLPALAVTAFAVPLACLAVASGFAGRLQAHLYWDPSAASRIAQFHLLDYIRNDQLLFGCSRADMIALLEPLRLAYNVDAIENWWLVMLVNIGVLAFPIFLLAIGALVFWLWRKASAAGRAMVVSLILATSTSNSLGHKSPLLVMLVGAVCASATPLNARRCREAVEAPSLLRPA